MHSVPLIVRKNVLVLTVLKTTPTSIKMMHIFMEQFVSNVTPVLNKLAQISRVLRIGRYIICRKVQAPDSFIVNLLNQAKSICYIQFSMF